VLAAVPSRRAAGQDLAPPELLEAAEAVYPEEARAAKLEGSVVLRLTIDVDGHVAEADVMEAAGHGFDAAAREAAMRFRFAPARRAGEPMLSRIRYVFPFRLPPEAPPVEPAPEPPVDTETTEETPPDRVEAPIGVSVQGERNEAQRLQQSAE